MLRSTISGGDSFFTTCGVRGPSLFRATEDGCCHEERSCCRGRKHEHNERAFGEAGYALVCSVTAGTRLVRTQPAAARDFTAITLATNRADTPHTWNLVLTCSLVAISYLYTTLIHVVSTIFSRVACACAVANNGIITIHAYSMLTWI